MTDQIRPLEVEAIEPSPFQYRREMNADDLAGLVASIQDHGILQPVLVREVKGKTHKGVKWQLVAGHRRCEAARLALFQRVPAIVKELTDIQAAELALIENVQREDPDDWATAQGIKKLMELSAKQGQMLSEAEVARRLQKSVSYVRNHLGLFNLHPKLQEVAQRHNAVKSSLYKIQEVAATDKLDELIEAVDKGASYKSVVALVERVQADEAHARESYKAPDTETQARMNGISVSRGRMLIGNQAAEAKQECARAIGQLRAWLPHLTPAERAKVVAELRSIQ